MTKWSLSIALAVGFVMLPAACGQVPDEPKELPAAGSETGKVAGPKPKVVVEKEAVDLGTVKEGEIVEAVFVLENQGEADLVIDRVRTSCGCTTVELKKEEKTIAPGKKQPITARFNTKGRPGKQKKTLTVTSNDPERSSLKLTLTAEVLTLAQVVPSTIYLRNVRRGEVSPRTVDILPGIEDAKVEIVSLEVPGDVLTYTSEPIEQKNGLGHRLRFAVHPDAPLGPLSGTAELTVRVGDKTEVKRIPLGGDILGDLVVRPPIVQLQKAAARGIQLRPVTITSSSGKPFNVLSASAGPNFKTTVKSDKRDTEHTILLKIAGEAADGPCGTFLEVRTDSMVQPLIQVPVYAHVAPRLALDPPLVLLKPGGGEKGRVQRVLMTRATGADFSILSVECDQDLVDVAPAQSDRTRPGFKVLRVALKEGAKPASQTAKITLTTDVPGAEKMEIPVQFVTGEGA